MIMDMEQRNQTDPGDPGAGSPAPSGSPALSGETSAGGAQTDGGGCSGPRGTGSDSSLRQLLGNLVRGIRLSLFLKVDPDQFCATPGALALLALCDFFCNLAVSFLLVGRGGSFAYSAVPGFFFHLPLFLLCGYLAGRVLCRPSLVSVLPVALVSLSIPLELCHALLERLAQLRQLEWLDQYLEAPHYYRFFWWWVAAGLLFLLRQPVASLARRMGFLPCSWRRFGTSPAPTSG